MTRLMSPNCEAAQGRPRREHHCTGCEGCSCHHVAPPSLAALYAERLAENGSARLEPYLQKLAEQLPDEPGESR